jgi:hypothetical protein
MSQFLLTLKRPLVRISRIRHRCGYGVHSPFAFNLITQVISEHTPYYKYKELEAMQKQLSTQKDGRWKYESRKLKRLLFRLVNYAQPQTIVDAGTLSASSLYLKAAKTGADYIAARDLTELFLESGASVDFLYMHDFQNPQLTEEVLRVCAARATEQSIFVVEGIGYTPEMRALWKRAVDNAQVGVTFDLYDVGILFFNQRRMKQEYRVCF